MTAQYIQTTATIDRDINFLFPFSFGKVEETDNAKRFRQNAETCSEFGSTAGIRIGIMDSPIGEEENPKIPEPSEQNTSASYELSFEENIESVRTQESVNTQQRLVFPTYDEEDILNWDAVVIPPPPRRSGTIRVRLIYKGRSKPIPIEDPWE